MAGRWVAGLVAAAVSVRGLATALVVLRGALIRTGIGALIVAAGEMVYQFGRLVAGAGGFGEALSLLGDVAAESLGADQARRPLAGAVAHALEARGERHGRDGPHHRAARHRDPRALRQHRPARELRRHLRRHHGRALGRRAGRRRRLGARARHRARGAARRADPHRHRGADRRRRRDGLPVRPARRRRRRLRRGAVAARRRRIRGLGADQARRPLAGAVAAVGLGDDRGRLADGALRHPAELGRLPACGDPQPRRRARHGEHHAHLERGGDPRRLGLLRDLGRRRRGQRPGRRARRLGRCRGRRRHRAARLAAGAARRGEGLGRGGGDGARRRDGRGRGVRRCGRQGRRRQRRRGAGGGGSARGGEVRLAARDRGGARLRRQGEGDRPGHRRRAGQRLPRRRGRGGRVREDRQARDARPRHLDPRRPRQGLGAALRAGADRQRARRRARQPRAGLRQRAARRRHGGRHRRRSGSSRRSPSPARRGCMAVASPACARTRCRRSCSAASGC